MMIRNKNISYDQQRRVIDTWKTELSKFET